ncbi:MAG: SBBP repeat-containing protein [Thermoplasmatota archaeon]
MLLLPIPVTAAASVSSGSKIAVEVKNTHDYKVELQDSFQFFSENKGQISEEIDLYGSTGFGKIGLSDDCFYLDVTEPYVSSEEVGGHVVRIDLLGSRSSTPEGIAPLPHLSNFFLGKRDDTWIAGANNYQEARYSDAWSGIDLNFNLADGLLKYEFLVYPWSDPGQIRLGIRGHDHITVRDREIEIGLAQDKVLIDGPLETFYIDDPTDSVECRFIDLGNDEIGFELGEYDRSRGIVIDPVIFSTYIGGSGTDDIWSVETDSEGMAYVAGTTGSTNFPTTTGAYGTSMTGTGDLFISKINTSGSGLMFSTYVGGSGSDTIEDLVIDSKGDAYITGRTSSTDFPTTTGSYCTTYNGSFDIYVLCLNRSGASLDFSTFVGTQNVDSANGIDLDSRDAPVIIGSTSDSSFPVTSGAFQTSFKGQSDIVVFRLSPNGSSLEMSTYVGGLWMDSANKIKVDGDGTIYCLGSTSSNDFPVVRESYNTTLKGWSDMVIFRLPANGSKMLNSTYFGGMGQDTGYAIIFDSSGNVVISGTTSSSDLPMITGSYDTSHGGGWDAFISKFDKDLKVLKASTYVGSAGNEQHPRVVADSKDRLILVGDTSSANFPTVNGSYDISISGNIDLFITRFDKDLRSIEYSSFFGGSASWWENPYDACMTGKDELIFGGITNSTDFPVTQGACDTTFNGGFTDAFLTKMTITYRPIAPDSYSWKVGKGWVNLTWSEKPQAGSVEISGYKVYYGNSTDNLALVGTIEKREWYNYTGMVVGEPHHLQVIAFSSDDESEPSIIVTARDNVTPGLGYKDMPEVLTTGEQWNFTVRAWDDVQIKDVIIDYSYVVGPHVNVSMNTTGDGVFHHKITVHDTLTNLTVRFMVCDMYRNWFISEMMEIDVVDNDPPNMTGDLSPSLMTTSDPYRFEVHVEDNIMIDTVFVRYSTQLEDLTVKEMEFKALNQYELTITAPDSLGKMAYSFCIRDRGGNWFNTTEREVEIMDNDCPRVISVEFDEVLLTGGSTTVRALVEDNIEVVSAHLYYRFSSGDFDRMDMLNVRGQTYEGVIDVPHTLNDLEFYIEVFDGFSNKAKSNIFSSGVKDDVPPELVENRTVKEAEVGSILRIEYVFRDNIALQMAFLEYSIGSSGLINDSMKDEGEGIWSIAIKVPCRLQNIKYRALFQDTSGNWNHTSGGNVLVIDSCSPEISGLKLSDIPSTGDYLTVSAQVHDNVEISEVMLHYKFPGIPASSIEMSVPRSGEYSSDIYILDSALEVAVWVTASDTSGNTFQTDKLKAGVSDNDPPECHTESYLGKVISDRSHELLLNITDNIGVDEVRLEYWIDKDNRTEVEMDKVPGGYSAVLKIPPGSYGKLFLSVIALDTAGNRWETGTLNRTIEDGTLPVMGPVDDIVLYEGDMIDITVEVSDDRGIADVFWSFLDMSGEGEEIEVEADVPGDHILEILVRDPAGNQRSLLVNITVLPIDHDADGDGIPDLYEIEFLLDMNDPRDASLDGDLDGLTNLEEYLNGTDMQNFDTDNDGMDDGWEVMYGLDPLTASSDKDTDGDGRTDLQEYRDGTDPTKADKELPLSLIIVLLLAAVVIGAGIYGLIRLRKSSSGKKEEEEEESKNPLYSKPAAPTGMKAAPSIDKARSPAQLSAPLVKEKVLEDDSVYIKPQNGK